MLLCFSDGLTDSLDRDGRTLGVDGIQRILSEMRDPDPDLLLSHLLEEVASRHEGNLSQDDLTVMLVQATDSKVHWQDNLLAPLRLLRPPRDRTDVDLY
jgi:serine phosphatase RsbU (regulator of sigma subunit)